MWQQFLREAAKSLAKTKAGQAIKKGYDRAANFLKGKNNDGKSDKDKEPSTDHWQKPDPEWGTDKKWGEEISKEDIGKTILGKGRGISKTGDEPIAVEEDPPSTVEENIEEIKKSRNPSEKRKELVGERAKELEKDWEDKSIDGKGKIQDILKDGKRTEIKEQEYDRESHEKALDESFKERDKRHQQKIEKQEVDKEESLKLNSFDQQDNSLQLNVGEDLNSKSLSLLKSDSSTYFLPEYNAQSPLLGIDSEDQKDGVSLLREDAQKTPQNIIDEWNQRKGSPINGQEYYQVMEEKEYSPPPMDMDLDGGEDGGDDGGSDGGSDGGGDGGGD